MPTHSQRGLILGKLASQPLSKNFFKRADVKDVPVNVEERVQRWQENITNMAFFLILAGSQTAEIEGISAAGSTAVSDTSASIESCTKANIFASEPQGIVFN